LLTPGADVNSPHGWALQAATANGHDEVAKYLLKKGASLNACIINNRIPFRTALEAATEAGLGLTVEILLAHGADPNLGAGQYACPIIAAARLEEEGILMQLIKAGAHLNVFGGPDKSTPLINAALKLPKNLVETLLDAGADANLPGADGDTALIVAAAADYGDCVKLLPNRGADILHSSPRDGNVIQMAVKNDSEVCVKILVEHVSVLMESLRTAIDGKNAVVTDLFQEQTTPRTCLLGVKLSTHVKISK
jgi:ankyrin repeat protein